MKVKKFVQILLMTLVVVECFLFFGGYAVFDFSRRYYTAGAVRIDTIIQERPA